MAFFKRMTLSESQRTAWVFGAGASVFYDVPPQVKLLSRFLDEQQPTRGSPKGQQTIKERRRRIEAYCRKVYPGLDPKDSGGEQSEQRAEAGESLRNAALCAVRRGNSERGGVSN